MSRRLNEQECDDNDKEEDAGCEGRAAGGMRSLCQCAHPDVVEVQHVDHPFGLERGELH